MFGLKTKVGVNIIDVNRIFGALGIQDTPIEMPSAQVEIDEQKSSAAGDLTSYIFTFFPNDIIESNHQIRCQFPEGVDIT
jgi:hypothetical protein